MSKAAQLRVQALQLYRTADQLYAVNKIDAANVIYGRYLGVQHKYKAEAYLERLPTSNEWPNCQRSWHGVTNPHGQ
jgi:hypothetical protein